MSTTFANLGVPAELVSTLKARGIDTPFAIQTLTLADGCAGRDLSGRAPTGVLDAVMRPQVCQLVWCTSGSRWTGVGMPSYRALSCSAR